MGDTRVSITHKFDIAGHEGYLTVGLFDDNKSPGELFITMAKEGSTIGGLMDTIGNARPRSRCNTAWPIEALVKKFSHVHYEPSGFTKNPDIRIAKSITDYIFRWMGIQFIPGYREANNPGAGQQELPMQEIQEIEKKMLNKPIPELPVHEDTLPGHHRMGGTHDDRDRLERTHHPLQGRPHLPRMRLQQNQAHRLLRHLPELRRQPRLQLIHRCSGGL